MRTNLPVTNTEYILTDSDSIVSITDLQGKITYINEDFKRISGFTEAELMGQPQNIVRHPDMPVEAFADFWATLKSGRPWVGYVKNRCKNGDYYWVKANATPMYERGQLTGYMSVRGKPSRTNVEAASNAYALFREGKAGGLKIQDGKVVKSSVFDRISFMKKMNIRKRLIFILSLLSVLILSMGILGMVGMSQMSGKLKSVYDDRLVAMSHLDRVVRSFARNNIALNNMLIDTSEEIKKVHTDYFRVIDH